MGKKTSIWIMSVLFGLGIIAAYHSDNKRLRTVQVNQQLSDAAMEGTDGSSIYGVEPKTNVG